MQPKTVAKRCRQTEEKDSHSMLRAILDKVVEYMTNPTIKILNESNWPFHDTILQFYYLTKFIFAKKILNRNQLWKLCCIFSTSPAECWKCKFTKEERNGGTVDWPPKI